jgi:hypothetical protein
MGRTESCHAEKSDVGSHASDSPVPGECRSTNGPADEEECRESPLHEERDADDFPNLDSELWKSNTANTLYVRSTSERNQDKSANPDVREGRPRRARRYHAPQ